jgi:RNA-directed DNA polymerase
VVTEVHVVVSKPRNCEWIVEGDIPACIEEIDHLALLGRVPARVADRRVTGLVKKFLMAGILGEDRVSGERPPRRHPAGRDSATPL